MTVEQNLQMAKTLAERVSSAGGRAYFVGGIVRDRLRGDEVKDVDVEVHGVTPETLASILDSLGERLTIGANFGIFGLRGYDLDIAMPRKEEATGRGHRDFAVFVDPFLGVGNAAKRRDFTVNAMMQDVLTGEIVDPFGGREDLERRVLRHVNDESFAEDPLRVLRGAQFAARFGFTVAPETVALCRKMDLSALPRERITGELDKAFLKSDRPSVFFEILREVNALSFWFPEVEALIGVRQDPIHHSEGDVFTHTMMVLDEAVKYRDRVKNPRAFLYSALAHDFGKPSTTVEEGNRVRSIGHEIAGVPIAEHFLDRLTSEVALKKYVLNMVKLHMRLNTLCFAGSSLKASNLLLDESVAPFDLACLGLADSRGKRSETPYVDFDDEVFARVRHYEETVSRPAVMGHDLTEAGLQPASDFSEILAFAHRLQVVGVGKAEALPQVLAYAAKLRKEPSKIAKKG